MTTTLPLNQNWEFRRLDPSAESWRTVELPHSAFVADLDGRNHWFGLCEYRRTLRTIPPPAGTRCVLHVGAAMHTALVIVDGKVVATHRGGYLPFDVDLTDVLAGTGPHELVLRLDNRDNPEIPPGKPFEDLDFCWFSGLYRDVELRLKPALHLTDAVDAAAVASGGVFIRTTAIANGSATLSIQTHVANRSGQPRRGAIRTEVLRHGIVIASALSPMQTVGPDATAAVEQIVTIEQPALWSPDAPHLHEARVTLLDPDGAAIDRTTETFGIRRIAFSRSGGFVINGRPMRLRGTNRHQELPGVGYAVPRAAHFRDARRIKEAGFDYVRLSHYPQSPDFLDACDQLGLVVMGCIPGWQFIGNDAFRTASCQAARDLIRRDRNHPCVVLWELSLNETDMDEEFMARLQAIGHEEYPGDQMFTCGWIDRYDVFIHSRQHGRIHSWQNGDKALVIAEYGDWEYYAGNEGFDQKTGAGVFDRWSTARQFRGDGERGLAQQAANHIAALNDTLSSPAALDGQWAMFDYARGYDPVRAAVGVMDVFRLPKFSYHFYRSQRDASENGAGWSGGPMVFIASHWLPESNLRIPVFSNCDQVELRLNGVPVARQRPARAAFAQHLPHAPFYFDLPRFTPGVLEAIGYIAGEPQARHAVATPSSPAALTLTIDDGGIFPSPGESDVLLAHASVVDARGQLCITDARTVTFEAHDAELWSSSACAAEAGIASAVIRLPSTANGFTLTARTSAAEGAFEAVLRWMRPAPQPKPDFAELAPAPAGT